MAKIGLELSKEQLQELAGSRQMAIERLLIAFKNKVEQIERDSPKRQREEGDRDNRGVGEGEGGN